MCCTASIPRSPIRAPASPANRSSTTRINNTTSPRAEIHTAETEIGTQVTVLIEVTAIHNRRLTLLIPHINLRGQETEAALQTIAIITTTQTESLAPVRESYHAVRVHGTARQVEF
jgi:hypothetical protein